MRAIEFLINLEADIVRRYQQGTLTKPKLIKAVEALLDKIAQSYGQIEILEDFGWVGRAINCWESYLRSHGVYKYVQFPSVDDLDFTKESEEPSLPLLRHYPAAAMFGTLDIEALRQEYEDPSFL